MKTYLLACTLTVAASSQLAFAAVLPTRSVNLSVTGSGSQLTQDPVGTITLTSSATTPTTQRFASAAASADFGILKATTESSASGASVISTGDVLGAQFTDGLTFSNAALTGTVGFVAFQILYHWEPTISVSSSASVGNPAYEMLRASAAISLSDYAHSGLNNSVSVSQNITTSCRGTNCSTINNGVGLAKSGNTTILESVPNQSFTARVSFVFGQEWELGGILLSTTSSGTGSGGNVSGSMDASHSLYWAGISSVTDSAGNPVEFGLSSASGSNYLNSFVSSVPELPSGVLLSRGLAIMGASARRKLCYRTSLA